MKLASISLLLRLATNQGECNAHCIRMGYDSGLYKAQGSVCSCLDSYPLSDLRSKAYASPGRRGKDSDAPTEAEEMGPSWSIK